MSEKGKREGRENGKGEEVSRRLRKLVSNLIYFPSVLLFVIFCLFSIHFVLC